MLESAQTARGCFPREDAAEYLEGGQRLPGISGREAFDQKEDNVYSWEEKY